MKKILLPILLLLVAQVATAGVRYAFIQRTASDMMQLPPSTLTGRAIIDGQQSRVDFLSGNAYPPGTFVVSTDGSRTLRFVDPLQKTYTEINAAALANSMGSANVKVENIKHDLQKIAGTELVAGHPTEHYHLTITYDITVVFQTMPLRQSVREEIDKWTTTDFMDVADTFLSVSAVRTGNPKLDELIELQTRKIQGFPLRQTYSITFLTSRAAVPGSKLNEVFSPVRTQRRELEITSIERINADPSEFNVPAVYRRIEAGHGDQKTTEVTTLSFDGKAQ
jgi:hypothetical protein